MLMVSRTTLDQFTLIRQSPVVLLLRLLIMDLFIIGGYFLVRFPLQGIYTETINIPIDNPFLEVGLFAILSIFEFILILTIMLVWMSDYYVIQSGTILHRQGVFKLLEETYSLKNIETFTVQQNFFQKIFRYGSIKFFSPVLKTEYNLHNVSQPVELKEYIQGLVIKEPDQETDEKIIPKPK